MDVFYALSHGVHRGVLKRGKFDERINFVSKFNLNSRDASLSLDGYFTNFENTAWDAKEKKNLEPQNLRLRVISKLHEAKLHVSPPPFNFGEAAASKKKKSFHQKKANPHDPSL